jgi:hypothetical protein
MIVNDHKRFEVSNYENVIDKSNLICYMNIAAKQKSNGNMIIDMS